MKVTIKEEAKNVMFSSKKDSSKVKNTLLQWILQNILENQTFQKIAKLFAYSHRILIFMYIFGYFFQKGHFKGFSKKSAHRQKILGGGAHEPSAPPAPEDLFNSASYSLFYERWRWNWMIKVLLEFALECPCVYYASALLRSRLHLVRDGAAGKEFDIAM